MIVMTCVLWLYMCIANMDYVPINTVNDLNELLSNELIIEAINDDVYEGSTDEKFLVIAEIVSGGHNGRVTIQPSSIEISIQDDDLQPGKFKCVHFMLQEAKLCRIYTI